MKLDDGVSFRAPARRTLRAMDKPPADPPKKPEPGAPTGYMQKAPGGDRDALGRPWPEVPVAPRKPRRRKR
jgi:hypothetical protein